MNTLTHAKLNDIKRGYKKNRMAYIPGEELLEVLIGLGAKRDDIEELQLVSEGLVDDPTLAFRRSRSGRFCYDLNKKNCYRTEFQPFVLSKEEDFIRHDSGKDRHFRGLSESLQDNTIFKSLLLFKHLVCHDIVTTCRPNIDYASKKWVCTVFNLRTITSPDLIGEPALEGVHTDGVDHTMTTLLGHHNMAEHSAKTFIHSMEEDNSLRWHDANPELILDEKQHNHFLDTLIICDNERKHSLSSLEAIDTMKEATRDMLIFFTRKPSMKGHVSYKYDSLNKHPDYPMALSLL
ncbi:2OG-Fe dioxygenase family protein [Moritella viscosa]|uniref:2OG-Fe dioxygenase family protein n=1 Tax=Moritella viscosa TaxID=80854 RepID=UPI00091A1EA8|nr:2OG-Fe dioxygenase family protein [Moritella viscosa]SGY91092.1 Putative uncharacterized protein [Moritella viscosa]